MYVGMNVHYWNHTGNILTWDAIVNSVLFIYSFERELFIFFCVNTWRLTVKHNMKFATPSFYIYGHSCCPVSYTVVAKKIDI